MYWIENKLLVRVAIVPRPRGGDWLEDECSRLRRDGIDIVVSMLTQDEAVELGLEAERAECEAVGIRFVPVSIFDRGVPSSAGDFRRVVEALAKEASSGKAIGIHCRAGIGRSSLMAAALLSCLGENPSTLFQRISECRGCAVPDTQEQILWFQRFAIEQ